MRLIRPRPSQLRSASPLRRWWLLLLGLAALTTAAGGRANVQSKRPNFVVVLVDDLGYADFSCYGNTRVRTPNIDRLASEGIRFTQFYTNSPICSPSRTALVTGQYPARWRVTSFIASREENQRRGMAQFLDPKAPSLARLLSQGGYATGHFGKWHLGGGRDVGDAPLISEYGFDASLTQFEGLGDRVLPIFDPHNGMPVRKAPLGLASEQLGRGKVTWRDRCEVTRAFVDGALDFIRQAETADRPFYVNVWPDDVHSPFFPPQDLRGDGTKRSLYDGTLANMDAQLGPLFDYVRRSPRLRDNTLILVLSDNGPEPGAGSAAPLRGSKGMLYEGGIRVPLIAWGPGLIPAEKQGSINAKSIFSSIDLAASIRSLNSPRPADTTKLDGEDLGPTLLGKSDAGRTQPLFWKRPPDRPGPRRNPFPDLAVRDGDWKLLMQEDGSGVQLYQLATDPSETRNVAEEHPETTGRLKKAVLDWNDTLPSPTAEDAGTR